MVGGTWNQTGTRLELRKSPRYKTLARILPSPRVPPTGLGIWLDALPFLDLSV